MTSEPNHANLRFWFKTRKKASEKVIPTRFEPVIADPDRQQAVELWMQLDDEGGIRQCSQRLEKMLGIDIEQSDVFIHQIVAQCFPWIKDSPALWPGELPVMSFRGCGHKSLYLAGCISRWEKGWMVYLVDVSTPMEKLDGLERRSELLSHAGRLASRLRQTATDGDYMIDEWFQAVALRLQFPWMAVAVRKNDTFDVVHAYRRLDVTGEQVMELCRQIPRNIYEPTQWRDVFDESAWVVPYWEDGNVEARLYCGGCVETLDIGWLGEEDWEWLCAGIAAPILKKAHDKKRRADELRQENLQKLLSGGWWEYHLETGMMRLGDGLVSALGLDESFLGGVPLDRWLECVDSRDREEFGLKLDIVRSHSLFHNLRLLKNGRVQWFRFQGNIVDTGDGSSVFGFAFDVNAVYEREAEAEAAKARLEALIDSVPGIIYVQGHDDGMFRMSYCSASLEELLGWPVKEFSEQPYSSILHPDDLDIYLQRTRQLLRQGRFSCQYRVRHRSGMYRWVQDESVLLRDGRGAAVEVVGVWLDISEAKSAEERILRSEERYRALVEDSPVIIYRYRPDLSVVFANQMMASSLDIESGKELSLNLADYLSVEEREKVNARLAGLTPEEPFANSEIWIRVSEFQTRCWVTYERGIFDQGGTLLEIQAVASDITAVHEARRVMLQSAKMATLGQMATGLAHEINQPLNVIHISLSNLLYRINRGAIDMDYLQGKMERISGQLQRVAKLVDHMRVFGRQSDLEGFSFDPRTAIDGALSLVRERLCNEGITIDVSEGELPEIIGQPDRLEQVLINLLINARDAMYERLRRKDDFQLVIGIHAETLNDELVLSVSDHGGGVAPEILDRIFEPFFTTKPVGEGTGLGLAISYAIVCQMSGKLAVENEGDGAVFKVILPIQD